MSRRALAVVLLALACPAWPAPALIGAEYELTNKGVAIGHVTESYRVTGRAYEIRSVSRSEGVLKALYDETITLVSAGRVEAEGLRPLQYEERRARDRKRDVTATFDWDKGIMHSRYRGEDSQLELPRGTQDRLSMMYQFMHLKPRMTQVTLPMTNGRKVERHTYRLVDEVRIGTPAGEFDTLHFERVSRKANDRHVEVWLAKERHNIPVRVVFDDPRGLRVEQTLAALKAE